MDNLIIGGGAAGLMCAGFAARAGKKVTVLERNASFARRVQITGKGAVMSPTTARRKKLSGMSAPIPVFFTALSMPFPRQIQWLCLKV